MCGVLGLVGPSEAALERRVASALRGLSHRGPDASGFQKFGLGRGTCQLGHTRLRIIDLSSAADQPLANEDGSVWVSYNGEIYNHRELRSDLVRAGHRFRSRSDTEVLVHLYEEAGGDPGRMLSRLRGMFAFALADARRGRLLLARDRLGIKPLYFSEEAGVLTFASEVRALARVAGGGAGPDLDAIGGYLLRGVIPGCRTVLSGVRELPPGCFAVWEDGRLQVERWWAPEFAPEPELARDADRLVAAALRDAVGRHLVADRPVGVFLSGGVDSGAVVRLAARQHDVRALTVTFPEAPDEEAEAAALAASAGARHERIPVTGDQVAEWLPEILASMDQPTSDGVNSWVVCRAAKEAGLVVALSGLGGDELFGGYPSFDQVPKVAFARRVLGLVPGRVRAAGARRAGMRRPGGMWARVLGCGPGPAGAYLAVRGMFAEAELEGAASHLAAATLDGMGGRTEDSVALLELGNYLPHQLLRDTDQMSMAHSLEVRVPLLDDSVVRVALALPARIRLAPGKALLVSAAGLDGSAPKRPFTLPFERWMRGPLREKVREGLLSQNLPFAQEIPQNFRSRLWEAFEAGRTHWSRPWAMAVLRLWPVANGFRW